MSPVILLPQHEPCHTAAPTCLTQLMDASNVCVFVLQMYVSCVMCHVSCVVNSRCCGRSHQPCLPCFVPFHAPALEAFHFVIQSDTQPHVVCIIKIYTYTFTHKTTETEVKQSSDPYVVFKIGSSTARSKTIQRNLNPEVGSFGAIST